MISTSTLTNVDDAAAGGGTGAGGLSGGPSARTETANTQANAIASRRLLIGLSPFSKLSEPDSIPSPESLFADFWELHCAGKPDAALSICDRLLEVIDPADLESHLRETNARAIALRDLHDLRGAYRVHLAARPFAAALKGKRPVGCHHHGLGVTFMLAGEQVAAFRELSAARDCYRMAGDEYRMGLADVNTARLYVLANRPGLAYALLDRVPESLRPDAETVRALAHEKEGDKPAARHAIASALLMLADSDNEATRKEALLVMERIEGRTTALYEGAEI